MRIEIRTRTRRFLLPLASPTTLPTYRDRQAISPVFGPSSNSTQSIRRRVQQSERPTTHYSFRARSSPPQSYRSSLTRTTLLRRSSHPPRSSQESAHHSHDHFYQTVSSSNVGRDDWNEERSRSSGQNVDAASSGEGEEETTRCGWRSVRNFLDVDRYPNASWTASSLFTLYRYLGRKRRSEISSTFAIEFRNFRWQIIHRSIELFIIRRIERTRRWSFAAGWMDWNERGRAGRSFFEYDEGWIHSTTLWS